MAKTNEQRLARIISDHLTRANGVPTTAIMVEAELQIHAEGAETVTRLLVPQDAYGDDNSHCGRPTAYLLRSF